MKLRHFTGRFFEIHPFTVNGNPVSSCEGFVEGCSHVELLAIVTLHHRHHLVIARQGRIYRVQSFRFMNGKNGARPCGLRPYFKSGARRRQVGKEKSAEKEVSISHGEWNGQNIVLYESELGMI